MSISLRAQITEKEGFEKILVVYFSHHGHTKKVADIIAIMTGAEVHRIERIKDYPNNAYRIAWIVGREDRDGKLPELKDQVLKVDDYDLIIVGSPVWRHTVSTPVLSFLKKCDFKEKPVAVFCTNDGNAGDFFERFKKEAKNAVIYPEFGNFYNKLAENNELETKVKSWLNQLK